ncbi:G-protein coupled receptor 143-like isoform X1 [Anopheles funestus]|uniref:G-protein coupled receptors family 2 profile 2 domain-containing protein n=1 Tax=Anopheles funestus TaxID=62324 RepID=A0A1Y9HDQ5_ANOFN|nr:G-protein coupled receptor 143-like isoform X1 [Anopheles funestus]
MADPTIQTFCCHNRIRSPPAIKLMSEFDTDGYIVVCLVSSVFGIAGAIYQIWIRHEDGPTHHAVRRRRGGELTLSSQNLGRQIIVWLAVADLCASFGVFLRSALWKYIKDVLPPDSDVDDTTNVIFCAVSSAWIQYFYMCTWLWTLCYAINVRRQLGGARYALRTYHYYVWSISALLTGIGLTVLYVPDADCHNVHDMTTAYMRILPNYVMTYGPMIAVMIANPVIYYQASREVDRQLVARFSQMSNTERDLMTKFKLKFSLINLVFYVCWLPNLVNGIVLWTMWFNLPFSMVITVWYIMAITNPLQAFFNSLVYQKWNCRWRLRRQGSSDSSAELRRRNRTSMVYNEGTPLLQAKMDSPSASTLHLNQPSVELIPTPTRSINSCSLV